MFAKFVFGKQTCPGIGEKLGSKCLVTLGYNPFTSPLREAALFVGGLNKLQNHFADSANHPSRPKVAPKTMNLAKPHQCSTLFGLVVFERLSHPTSRRWRLSSGVHLSALDGGPSPHCLVLGLHRSLLQEALVPRAIAVKPHVQKLYLESP